MAFDLAASLGALLLAAAVLWFFLGKSRPAPAVAQNLGSVGAATANPDLIDADTEDAAAFDEARLSVLGMTCASCVLAIDRTLRSVPGVTEASVNLAAEQASVSFDPRQVTPSEMISAIQRVGYDARVAGGLQESQEADEQARRRELRLLMFKFGVGAPLAVLLFIGSSGDLFGWDPGLLSHAYKLSGSRRMSEPHNSEVRGVY